jgi:hypothetical protein
MSKGKGEVAQILKSGRCQCQATLILVEGLNGHQWVCLEEEFVCPLNTAMNSCAWVSSMHLMVNCHRNKGDAIASALRACILEDEDLLGIPNCGERIGIQRNHPVHCGLKCQHNWDHSAGCLRGHLVGGIEGIYGNS